MEINYQSNEVQVANVMLTKEQVIENLTVKATTKYKSYVAAYVEKYTADDSKVKKSLEQLYNMDEKKLNTALRNFINGDTVKDADDVIRKIENSNFIPSELLKLSKWAGEKYEAVRVEFENKLLAEKEAQVQKLMAEIEALKQQQ